MPTQEDFPGARDTVVRAEHFTSEFGPARSHAVIVAGMHRSGTSAMTGVLSVCGLQPPRSPIAGDAFNEDGYFESSAVNDCNEAILKEMSSAWDDVLGSRPSRVGRYTRSAVESIKMALLEDFATDRDFIVKDPRISVLMSPWRTALHELALAPRMIIMVRNPLDVAASLQNRDKFPPTKSALLWLAHVIAVERDSRDLPRVFVTYDELLRDWRQTIRRAERTLGLRLPRWNDDAAMEIDTLLSERKRHFTSDAATLRSHTEFPAWIGDAYDWVLAAAAEQNPDPSRLDEIASAFHEAGDVFASTLAFERRRSTIRDAYATAPTEAISQQTNRYDLCVYSATASEPFDEKSGALIACGEQGRAHVFNNEGRHVTSFVIRQDAIQFRVRNQRWRPASPDEVRQLKSRVHDAAAHAGKGSDESA